MTRLEEEGGAGNAEGWSGEREQIIQHGKTERKNQIPASPAPNRVLRPVCACAKMLMFLQKKKSQKWYDLL